MFYFSKNCYLNYFYDEDAVKTNILAAVLPDVDEQATLYNDPKYGMNSIKTLSIWTAAYIQQQGYMFATWEYQPQV
jgi:hypothetical protein